MKFEKLGQSGRARRGRLTLEHGVEALVAEVGAVLRWRCCTG